MLDQTGPPIEGPQYSQKLQQPVSASAAIGKIGSKNKHSQWLRIIFAASTLPGLDALFNYDGRDPSDEASPTAEPAGFSEYRYLPCSRASLETLHFLLK